MIDPERIAAALPTILLFVIALLVCNLVSALRLARMVDKLENKPKDNE